MIPFDKFGKISRLSRECIITEKLDGTNAQICIVKEEDLMNNMMVDLSAVDGYTVAKENGLYMFAGSRTRWLKSGKEDNFNFYAWCKSNASELYKLGEGRHFGEWYGQGIQRHYGLKEKRLALFNVSKWADPNVRPSCCEIVPVLSQCMFDSELIGNALMTLSEHGSYAVDGFMNPEGIVIFHTHSGYLFKKTIKDDEKPKGVTNE